jgi:hypothetical protein
VCRVARKRSHWVVIGRELQVASFGQTIFRVLRINWWNGSLGDVRFGRTTRAVLQFLSDRGSMGGIRTQDSCVEYAWLTTLDHVQVHVQSLVDLGLELRSVKVS